MRVVVWMVLAGCSYAPSAGAPDADPGADPLADAADGPGAQPAPFVLSGEDWLLPCITNGQPNDHACTCANGTTRSVTIGGVAGERWLVTVQIRGVMERMGYAGGIPEAAGWYVGGTPGDAGNNFYKLSVSAPEAHFFINSGTPSQNNSWPFDYQASFTIDAGATVTFESSGQDQVQWEGVDPDDQPIAITGITDPVQPYNGQFAQLDVISAEPN